MRARQILIVAALAVGALGAERAAQAQSPVSCSAAPASVCGDAELQALESERAGLIAELSQRDPQSAALASEQTWVDGLSACGEDLECYRTAYLNHNQTLRQSVDALPAAPGAEAALEAPADAPTVEEETAALDDLQEQRFREAAQAERETGPREPGQVYVEAGMPGWGFFTAIGVTLFLGWQLMRARRRHRG